jgi:hypothetical protein
MWLTIDGQKQRRVTGTDDPDKAAEMLVAWTGKVEFRKDARLMLLAAVRRKSYKRYGIEELDSERDALDAVTV